MRGLLLGLVMPIAVLCFASTAWTEEAAAPAAPAAPAEKPAASGAGDDTLLTKLNKESQDALKTYADESAKKADAAAKAEIDKINADFNAATKQLEGSVEVNGKTVNFVTPKDAAAVRDDMLKRAVVPMPLWSLRGEDFRFDLPVEVTDPRPYRGSDTVARERVYLVLPFTITNSLIRVDVKDKDGRISDVRVVNSDDEVAAIKARAEAAGRTISAAPMKGVFAPRITMITDGGVVTPEVCAFTAKRAVEVSTLTKRAWTPELIGFARESKETGAFEPGETKAGVAIFPRYDTKTTSVRFLIEGLSNELNFAKDLRRVMVLEFVRPGNVYYPGQTRLAFKRRIGEKLYDPKENYLPSKDDSVHHGFDLPMLWNWDAASTVAVMPKATEVDNPAGGGKQKFWSYEVTIANRTGMEQPLAIQQVSTIVKLELLGKTVEIPMVDDGALNVYKAAFLEAAGKRPASSRFPAGTLADGDKQTFTVVFRESDFDFSQVCSNLADALTLDLARARNAGGGGYEAVAGVARLDKERMEQARKELLEKLPAALEAQLGKKVVAQITAKSGLASGTREMVHVVYDPAFKAAAVPAKQ